MKEKAKTIIKNFKTIFKRPEMAILPGHLAFFFFLSVVPIITLIGYAASLFDLPISIFSEFLEKAFSKDIVELIVPIIGKAEVSLSFFVLIIFGFYIASNGCRSLIMTSNTIYGITGGSKVNIRVKSIIMTIIIVILFLFILVVPVFGNKIIDLIKYIGTDAHVTDNIETIFSFLKGPFTWIFMFVFIKIIYTMAPDKKISSSSVNLGALFTTVLWTIITALFSYYVTHFARYDLLYAGLSNIVILMLWVYFLAIVFVYGLALNHSEDIKLEKTGIIKTIKN